MHHLAGRMSWRSELRAAVHREIANLSDTGAKKYQGKCACVTAGDEVGAFKYSTSFKRLILEGVCV